VILFYGCINDEVLDNVTHEHKHRYNTSYTTSDKAKVLQPKIAKFKKNILIGILNMKTLR